MMCSEPFRERRGPAASEIPPAHTPSGEGGCYGNPITAKWGGSRDRTKSSQHAPTVEGETDQARGSGLALGTRDLYASRRTMLEKQTCHGHWMAEAGRCEGRPRSGLVTV